MNQADPGKPQLMRVVVGAFVVFLVVVVGVPWLSWGLYRNQIGSRGQFGDQFGMASAIFSGLAFIGIAATWRLQHYELRESQKMQRAQAAELRSNAALARQQAFESYYFKLLETYWRLAEDVHHPGPDPRGKALGVLSSILRGRLRQLDVGSDRGVIHRQYDDWYKDWAESLGHLFRIAYHCVKAADESEFDGPTKYRYVRIFRAQLSEAELILLFYNCLGTEGQNMLPLAEKYNLFDNLRRAALARPEDAQWIKSTYAD